MQPLITINASCNIADAADRCTGVAAVTMMGKEAITYPSVTHLPLESAPTESGPKDPELAHSAITTATTKNPAKKREEARKIRKSETLFF